MTEATKYEFTPEMGEISGFGDGYEECCRATLKATLEFWDEQPEGFDPKYATPSTENIEFYGVVMDQNEDAKSLDEAMRAASAPLGGLTGAMHQAVLSHAFYVRQNGWESYVEEMSRRRDDEEGGEA